MNGFGYKLLVFAANLCGPWFFMAAARVIAAGYFVVFSGRRKESRRFYAALYPERGKLFSLWCAFRQYQNFTTIHFDRFLTGRAKTADFTSEGWERIEAVVGKEGGILLMSHLGNWEMAATLLRQQKKETQILLYMGVKGKEGVERMQKEDLRKAGITVISVDQEENTPFAAVEGINCLRSGGLVSMTGDRLWRTDQRKVRISFLGHEAFLPEAPFIFALISGSPLFAFFAFRTGRNRYHFTLSEPIAIRPSSRQARAEAVAQAAQQYAGLLEQALRQHPFEWYHFDRFLH